MHTKKAVLSLNVRMLRIKQGFTRLPNDWMLTCRRKFTPIK